VSLRFFFLCVFGALSTEELREFEVIEQIFSFPTTLEVRGNLDRIATVRQDWLVFPPTFSLEDSEGNTLATAVYRMNPLILIADIFDKDGSLLATIEEEILRILPWAKYKLFSPTGEHIATAEMNVWGTQFDLASPSNQLYASLWRPFFRLGRDHWKVEIYEEGRIDFSLVVFLTIFQTTRDERRNHTNDLLSLLPVAS